MTSIFVHSLKTPPASTHHPEQRAPSFLEATDDGKEDASRERLRMLRSPCILYPIVPGPKRTARKPVLALLSGGEGNPERGPTL